MPLDAPVTTATLLLRLIHASNSLFRRPLSIHRTPAGQNRDFDLSDTHRARSRHAAEAPSFSAARSAPSATMPSRNNSRTSSPNPAMASTSLVSAPMPGIPRSGAQRLPSNVTGRSGTLARLPVGKEISSSPPDAFEMLVIDQVARPAHRRERKREPLEDLRQLVDMARCDHLGDQRQHPGPRRRTVLVGLKPGMAEPFLAAELPAEVHPLAVADDPEEELRAVRRGEQVIDRPGPFLDRPRLRDFSGGCLRQDRLRHQKNVVLEQCGLHFLPAAGALTLAHRSLNRNDTEHRAHDVIDRGAGAHRLARAGRS